jgi:hypothetical protein
LVQDIPDDIDEDTDDLNEIDIDYVPATNLRLIHSKYPTGAWYIIKNNTVILKQGSKVSKSWKQKAKGYVEGYADAENNL